MSMFLVMLSRSGPQWDPSRPMEEQADWPAHASFMDGLVAADVVVLGGPLADERRVLLAVEGSSEEEIRGRLVRDPWSGSHLRVETIEQWTIRLDGRRGDGSARRGVSLFRHGASQLVQVAGPEWVRRRPLPAV